MDTEKCRALLVALDSGSLSAAAKQLGYTVGGVSRMMAILEEETGFPLLIRSKSGVSPTSECEALLPVMRELVYTAEKYGQTASALRGLDSGCVTVGVSCDTYYRWLASAIAGFSSLHPAIRINTVYDVLSSRIIEMLNEHSVDLCIISRRDGAVGWTQIKCDELVAIVHCGDPLSKLDRIPLELLEKEPYIEISPGCDTDNARMLAKNGIVPDVRYTCTSVSAACSLVSAGLGFTLLNAMLAQSMPQELKAVGLSPPQYVDIGIATNAADETSPAAQSFISYLKKTMNTEQG